MKLRVTRMSPWKGNDPLANGGWGFLYLIFIECRKLVVFAGGFFNGISLYTRYSTI
jgi:hypothetical protein